ncbi:MAG: ABC transporter permease [Thermaerobacterales bacterium]
MAYFIQRIFWFALTALGVLTLVFLLLRLAPGDPVEVMFDIQTDNISVETIERIRRDYGLDLPLHRQYLNYIASAIRGDFGTSFYFRRPVAQEMKRNFPPTAALAVAGISIAITLGVGSGIISALRPNTLIDYIVTTVSMLGLSAPNFWLGILLIYVFAFQLRWFPIVSSATTLTEHLHILVLPALTIGTSSAALIARMTRSAVLEVLGLDYIRTAYAKGLAQRTVVYKHALRNAAIPVITIAGLSFAALLGGAVVVEFVFAREGLGWLIVGAVYNRDYPVLQGSMVLLVVIIMSVNLLVDLTYTLLDPRIRYD